MRRVFFLVLLGLSAACGKSRPPEILAVLPEFNMTAVREKGTAPFGRSDMLGRVWIVDFIFTRCGGPCPLLSTRLATLSRKLPPNVGLLSITVDPDWDTADRLREYAKAYGAAPDRWQFLRGSTEDTYRLVFAGYRQAMSINPRAPIPTRVTHSTRFVLVDKAARIRGFYEALNDEDNAVLTEDVRRLLEAGS